MSHSHVHTFPSIDMPDPLSPTFQAPDQPARPWVGSLRVLTLSHLSFHSRWWTRHIPCRGVFPFGGGSRALAGCVSVCTPENGASPPTPQARSPGLPRVAGSVSGGRALVQQWWVTWGLGPPCSSPVLSAVCLIPALHLTAHLTPSGPDGTPLLGDISGVWSFSVPWLGVLPPPGFSKHSRIVFKRHILLCCEQRGLAPEPRGPASWSSLWHVPQAPGGLSSHPLHSQAWGL